MFFIASKLLHFFLNPAVWIAILLLLTFFAKSVIRRRRLLLLSLLVVFIFGNSFIIDEIYRKYEVEAVKIDNSQHFDYGVVLSGMTVWDNDFKRVNFHGNIDRLLQALPLHSKHIIDTLVLSGGDGSAFQSDLKESLALKRYLESISYSTNKFIIEADSRNTHENAEFTVKELTKRDPKIGSEKVLLITSALHMRRSLACFKKQGLNCTPYVTNRLAGPRKYAFDHMFVPNAESMHCWKAFLHEIVGFVIYSFMDYI